MDFRVLQGPVNAGNDEPASGAPTGAGPARPHRSCVRLVGRSHYGYRQPLGCLLMLDLRVSEQMETAGDHGEAFVRCPQPSVRSEPGRGKKLGVNVPDA